MGVHFQNLFYDSGLKYVFEIFVIFAVDRFFLDLYAQLNKLQRTKYSFFNLLFFLESRVH